MKTQVFSHKNVVGILATPEVDGIIARQGVNGSMGWVVKASDVEISQEALDLLKQVEKCSDAIGDIDVFQSTNDGVIFAWLGFGKASITPGESEASRSYNPSLLDGVATIVPNSPPKDFVEYVDKISAQADNQGGEK